MKRRITILAILGTMAFSQLTAQEKPGEENVSPWSVSCDIYSRYVWRGTDFGNSPSIQPGITYSSGALAVGAWGAWQFNGSANENDIFISYQAGPLNVTLTDYFFPSQSGESDDFFNTNSNDGSHFLELSLSTSINAISITGGYFFVEPGSDTPSFYSNISYGPFHIGLGNGMYTTVDKNDGSDIFGVVDVGVTSTNGSYSCSWILNPNQQTTFLTVGKSF